MRIHNKNYKFLAHRNFETLVSPSARFIKQKSGRRLIRLTPRTAPSRIGISLYDS